jgi:hypothetical protein
MPDSILGNYYIDAVLQITVYKYKYSKIASRQAGRIE